MGLELDLNNLMEFRILNLLLSWPSFVFFERNCGEKDASWSLEDSLCINAAEWRLLLGV